VTTKDLRKEKSKTRLAFHQSLMGDILRAQMNKTEEDDLRLLDRFVLPVAIGAGIIGLIILFICLIQ
jgi:hypothetical protein